ncbi:MAG: hypothetical protein ABSB36_02540 [Candidatus Dormibacteria bacterium]|jgi:hypothetical protein
MLLFSELKLGARRAFIAEGVSLNALDEGADVPDAWECEICSERFNIDRLSVNGALDPVCPQPHDPQEGVGWEFVHPFGRPTRADVLYKTP